MIPSPSELRYFLEVSNTQNISRAAERLGISQPSLSLAMRRLEDSFGAPLLIRSKSGVRLTRGGQKFALRARALLHEWENVKSDAMKDESEISGRYVIGCHNSVALYTLPDLLPDITRENPKLELKLMHDLSRKVTEDVISFKIDFGIVVNPTRHPDLVIRPLFNDVVTFWRGASSFNPSVLLCDPDLIQTQSLQKQIKKMKTEMTRSITSSNLEVIASLVANGAGVGILPTRVAQIFAEKGIRPIKGAPCFEDKICLVYRSDAQKTPASRKLAQSILDRLTQTEARSESK